MREVANAGAALVKEEAVRKNKLHIRRDGVDVGVLPDIRRTVCWSLHRPRRVGAAFPEARENKPEVHGFFHALQVRTVVAVVG